MKSTYGLWVTQAEHDEIAATPSTPGADTEPTGTPPVSVPPPSPSTSRTVFLRPPPTEVEASVYYPNCQAARDAGAAPIYAGQPGYRPGLDRDHDDIACE